MEREVPVEARQAGDHAPGGGARGEGDHQEAEEEETAGAEAVPERAEESRLQEAAWPWPCRRRHLVAVAGSQL